MISKTSILAPIALFAAAAMILPAGCTEPKEATRQLEQMGYTAIKTTGYDFFACSKDDSYATGFEATSPNGTRVEGVYCSGFMKAGTVRFY